VLSAECCFAGPVCSTSSSLLRFPWPLLKGGCYSHSHSGRDCNDNDNGNSSSGVARSIASHATLPKAVEGSAPPVWFIKEKQRKAATGRAAIISAGETQEVAAALKKFVLRMAYEGSVK
jgi:hypothetical protein